MKLSENFSLHEFEISATAERFGINNAVPPDYIPRLKALCEHVLQPVREEFGPVTITSGYRSTLLNQRVGGAPTSQHRFAEAADFKVPGKNHREICLWISQNCVFDQLIYEYGERGWIHVSHRIGNNREEVLHKRKGKPYLPGLGQ